MSDTQYDLTLAGLADAELDRWHRTLVFGSSQAYDADENTDHLVRRLQEVAVEKRRRISEADTV